MAYTIQISNKYYENLVYNDWLGSFSILEMSGNLLPMFVMTFMDTDKDKIRTLNELTPLKILYTIDSEAFDTEWLIKIAKISESNQGFSAIIGGYLNRFSYYKNNKVPYIKGNSQEALKSVAENYFKFTDKAEKFVPNDSMVWLSHNYPDRIFVSEIWKHSYLENDTTLVGITSEAEFIRTTLLAQLQAGYKVLFSQSNKDEGVTFQSLEPISSSLDYTSLFGYSTEREILDSLTGEITTVNMQPSITMIPSNNLNQSTDIDKRMLPPYFQSRNVHSNYMKGLYKNIVNLGNISNNTIKVTINGNCKLKLLDLMRIESQTDATGRKVFDGLYITDAKLQSFTNNGRLTSTYIGKREVSEEIK